jgi:Zn-dependent protease
VRQACTIGQVAGIPIEVQASWPPVFLFVTWSLADQFFPRLYPQQGAASYWIASGVASCLLFCSVLVHEFGHALVARGRGLTVYRVSLFFLGGLVEIDLDGSSAADEFWLALAGPALSLLLGVAFGASWLALGAGRGYLAAIAIYLALCNGLLAGFNLLPGFPLDGGRIVRACLWGLTGSRGRATRWAGWLGQGLGGITLILGTAGLLQGDALAGFWLVAVGVFLAVAARGVLRTTPVPR